MQIIYLPLRENGITSLKKSKTVATLLPGTGYFSGKNNVTLEKLLDNGVKVSIASDYNPGSCHQMNLLKIAVLSAPNYQNEYFGSLGIYYIKCCSLLSG